MLRTGVKEVRDHFTQYLKMVKKGEEIVVTERGRPVALIKPVAEIKDMRERLESAAEKGLIRLPLKEGNIPVHKKVKLTGKSLTKIILEEREAGW
jgi:prevent-host-death family protein